MIEFATLLISLVIGVQTVELVVADDVATVELRLDGDVVARKTEPPWLLEVDFGMALVPHELSAVAFSDSGAKIGEARQWVNYSREGVEARWVADPESGWPPRKARLVWQSYNGTPPSEVVATFDGERLDLGPQLDVELRDYDTTVPHVLEAELTFLREFNARAELTFGGMFGESVSSALTAVALDLPEGVSPPSPEEGASWLRLASGRPVLPHSVDGEGGLVILVRDRGLSKAIPVTAGESLKRGDKERRRLRKSIEIRLLRTIADPLGAASAAARGEPPRVFTSFVVGGSLRRRGLFFTARRVTAPDRHPKQKQQGSTRDQQIFDALAVAGKLAAQSGQRRAVLLMRDPRSTDSSLLLPQQAEKFLRAVRVPLETWTPGEESSLVSSVERIEDSLARQAVIWIQGRFLPREVLLSNSAPAGVRFAGVSTEPGA